MGNYKNYNEINIDNLHDLLNSIDLEKIITSSNVKQINVKKVIGTSSLKNIKRIIEIIYQDYKLYSPFLKKMKNFGFDIKDCRLPKKSIIDILIFQNSLLMFKENDAQIFLDLLDKKPKKEIGLKYNICYANLYNMYNYMSFTFFRNLLKLNYFELD